MPDLICDTSPIQYLYQLDLLHIIPALGGRIFVPPAVVDEIKVGLSLGVNLPDPDRLDWAIVQQPVSEQALPLITNLGPGEAESLMLALEMKSAVLVLDDGLAREIADTLNLQFTGTLGLLLDAKQTGIVPEVRPLLDKLQLLRFRLALHTYETVLHLAGESL